MNVRTIEAALRQWAIAAIERTQAVARKKYQEVCALGESSYLEPDWGSVDFGMNAGKQLYVQEVNSDRTQGATEAFVSVLQKEGCDEGQAYAAIDAFFETAIRKGTLHREALELAFRHVVSSYLCPSPICSSAALPNGKQVQSSPLASEALSVYLFYLLGAAGVFVVFNIIRVMAQEHRHLHSGASAKEKGREHNYGKAQYFQAKEDILSPVGKHILFREGSVIDRKTVEFWKIPSNLLTLLSKRQLQRRLGASSPVERERGLRDSGLDVASIAGAIRTMLINDKTISIEKPSNAQSSPVEEEKRLRIASLLFKHLRHGERRDLEHFTTSVISDFTRYLGSKCLRSEDEFNQEHARELKRINNERIAMAFYGIPLKDSMPATCLSFANLLKSPITIENIRRLREILEPGTLENLAEIGQYLREPLDSDKMKMFKEFVGEAASIGDLFGILCRKDIASLKELRKRLEALQGAFAYFKGIQGQLHDGVLESHLQRILVPHTDAISANDILIRNFSQAKKLEARKVRKIIEEKLGGIELDDESKRLLHCSFQTSIDLVIALRFMQEVLAIAGEDEAKEEITDLRKFIERDVIPPFNQNGHSVVYNFSVPARIEGFRVNPYALSLVLEKIISNAIWQASAAACDKDAAIVIDIGAKAEEDSVVITIRDYGPGVAPEYCQRGNSGVQVVFEEGVGTRTGIGMALSNYLMRFMNGSISFENNVQESGVTFTVAVPLEKPSRVSLSVSSPVERERGLRDSGAIRSNLTQQFILLLINSAPKTRRLSGKWEFKGKQRRRLFEWLSEADTNLLPSPHVLRKLWNHIMMQRQYTMQLFNGRSTKENVAMWYDLLSQRWHVRRKTVDAIMLWFLHENIRMEDVSALVLHDFFRVLIEHYSENGSLRPLFNYVIPHAQNSNEKLLSAATNIKRITSIFSYDFAHQLVIMKAPIKDTPYYLALRFGFADGSFGVTLYLGRIWTSDNRLRGKFFKIGVDTQGDRLRVITIKGVEGENETIKRFTDDMRLGPGRALLHVATALADREGFKVLIGLKEDFHPTVKESPEPLNYQAIFKGFGLRRRSAFGPWATIEHLRNRLRNLLNKHDYTAFSIQSVLDAFECLGEYRTVSSPEDVKSSSPVEEGTISAQQQGFNEKQLELIAAWVTNDLLGMIQQSGSGHFGASLSVKEILVSLYFDGPSQYRELAEPRPFYPVRRPCLRHLVFDSLHAWLL